MKKIILLIVFLSSLLSGEYILRDSESNIKFNEFEYLQGGILYRFDFKQVEHTTFEGETQTMWRYKEIWLPEDTDRKTLNRIIRKEKLKKATAKNLKKWKAKTQKPEHKLNRRK